MKVIWGPRRKRLCGWALSFLTAAVLLSEPVQSLSALPDEIRLTEGYDAHVALSPLASASLEAEQAALVSHDQTLGEVTIAGRQAGSATMTVRLLGVVPIKQVSVRVEEEKVLVPGGQAVGVAIRTAGVLVVGASDLGGGEASPAREAGVRAGDLITAVDGEPVNEAERLSELVNGDAERRLTLNRAGQELSVSVRPRQDARDQAYRLGVWVRDSTAGVGTLSFYDPATGAFAGDGIAEQTRQSLKNVQAVLEAGGSSLGNVLKTTVFLKNMDDFAAMNEVYATFFEGEPPARSAVEVARLPKGALVEIEAIAFA